MGAQTQPAPALTEQLAVSVVRLRVVVQQAAARQAAREALTVQRPSGQRASAPQFSARAAQQALQLPQQVFLLRAAELRDGASPAVRQVRSHRLLRSFPVLPALVQLRLRDGDGVLRHRPERARAQEQAVRQPMFRGDDGTAPQQVW
jgi:hypothetical protein